MMPDIRLHSSVGDMSLQTSQTAILCNRGESNMKRTYACGEYRIFTLFRTIHYGLREVCVIQNAVVRVGSL